MSFIPAFALIDDTPQGSEPTAGIYCPALSQTLTRGMRDTQTTPPGQVTELQHFLSDYYDVSRDDIMTGYFGNLTQRTVIRFQNEQGLPAYGIVGSLTRAAISRVCGGGETASNPADPTISVAPTNGVAPQVATLTTGNLLAGVDYTLSFDDGSTQKIRADVQCVATPCLGTKTVTHTYVSAGTYHPSLRTAQDTILARATVVISASGQDRVSLTASPTSGTAPLSVVFTGSTNRTSTLEFGDGGSRAVANFANPLGANSYPQYAPFSETYIYQTAGLYTAKLTAASGEVRTVAISVGTGTDTQPKSLTFTLSPASGVAPLTVNASAALGDEESGWVDFGDGTGAVNLTRSGANGSASHVYAAAGTYTVTLSKRSCSASIVGMQCTIASGQQSVTVAGQTTSAASCTWNGQTVAHGSSVTAYQSSSVPADYRCVSETRTCNNGALSGSYQYASCNAVQTQTVPVANPPTASCTWNGQTVAHGSSVTAYQSSSVPADYRCVSETRTCNNGALSGSYQYASCNAVQTQTVPVANPPTASCTWNGQTVAHGSSVTAYQYSSNRDSGQCVSQTRTCNNGVLSGTYQYPTCSTNLPSASCTPSLNAWYSPQQGAAPLDVTFTWGKYGLTNLVSLNYGDGTSFNPHADQTTTVDGLTCTKHTYSASGTYSPDVRGSGPGSNDTRYVGYVRVSAQGNRD